MEPHHFFPNIYDTFRFLYRNEQPTIYRILMPKRNLQRFLTLATALSLMNISTTGCNRTYQPNSKTKQMSHLAKSICSTRSLAQKHHLAHIFASAPATKTRVQKKKSNVQRFAFVYFFGIYQGNLSGEDSVKSELSEDWWNKHE